MARFLDTNILLRHLVRDDESKAQASRALLLRLERGEETVITTDIAIFEAVYILQSPRHYALSRNRIRHMLEPLIGLRGLRIESKSLYPRVFDLFCTKNISFADAYHAAYMELHDIAEVYSYDTDFDRVQGVTRVEPEG